MAILLITRPEPAATRFLRQVQAAFSETVLAETAPLIQIEPIDVDVPAAPVDIIFTSENGVAQAARLGFAHGLAAWCVGNRTAKAATDAGYAARTADGDAAALTELLLRDRPKGPLLHIRGEHARGDIAVRLSSAGLACTDLIAYRQRALPLPETTRAILSGASPVVIPLFSPRTASLLKDMGSFTAPLHVVTLSQAVAVAFSGVPVQSLAIAALPDGPSMTAATCRVLATLGNR